MVSMEVRVMVSVAGGTVDSDGIGKGSAASGLTFFLRFFFGGSSIFSPTRLKLVVERLIAFGRHGSPRFGNEVSDNFIPTFFQRREARLSLHLPLGFSKASSSAASSILTLLLGEFSLASL